MAPEVAALVEAMEVRQSGAEAGFRYWAGHLQGHDCVVARSGMGKVSAAACVQRLIDVHGAARVLLCGLCGGLRDDLGLGDVVVGETYVQYDVDATPLFARYQVPGLDAVQFSASPELVDAAVAAATAFAGRFREAVATERLASLGIDAPKVVRGLVLTGDLFVKDDKRLELKREFPDALCVEMEGAALAQVCQVNGVPFVVVRVVSDFADRGAPADFTRFVDEVAPRVTSGIVRELLRRLPG